MFFSVKRIFEPFPDIQPNFIGHLSQSLRRGCQNWIQHERRIMSRENLLFPRSYTFFIKFLLWVKYFHPSSKELLSDLSKNCVLIDQNNNLQLNYSEKNWLFNPYRTSAVINSAFRGTCANGVNKIAFSVTIGTLLGQKTSHQIIFPSSLSGSEREFFSLLWKIFHRVCQSAFIPPVHKNLFGEKLPKILYLF